MWCRLRLLNDLAPVQQKEWVQCSKNKIRFLVTEEKGKPVHSLLFVKSMPTIRFEDSRPACASAAVTYKDVKMSSISNTWAQSLMLWMIQCKVKIIKAVTNTTAIVLQHPYISVILDD